MTRLTIQVALAVMKPQSAAQQVPTLRVCTADCAGQIQGVAAGAWGVVSYLV
jgi:hypothetical protein